jgi:hypothetical protein
LTEQQKSQMQNNVDQLFYNINAYKRHRTLMNSAKHKNNMTDATFQELKTYQYFDAIELSARAIQKEVRGVDAND